MSLEEAIRHCTEVAYNCSNRGVRLDPSQLLVWLEELKVIKDNQNKGIWIARDMAILEDIDLQNHIERYPEDSYMFANLYAFYDTPIWEKDKWVCAREAFLLPSYMYPEIKEGMCAKFKLVSLKHYEH